MKIIDKSETRKLEQKLKRLAKNNEELINYIAEMYRSDGIVFHRLLLHSGYLIVMKPDCIEVLLERLSSDEVNYQYYSETLEFISYLLRRKQYYDDKLQELFVSNSKYINVESIFTYIEKIQEKMKQGLSMNDEILPEFVIESQFEHILESFPEIIEFIRKYKVNIDGTKITAKQLEVSHEIIKLVGHKSSIRTSLLSTMMELTSVKKCKNFKYQDKNFDFIYFKSHNLSYWKQFEVYRDLNFMLYKNFIENADELELMKSSGLIKAFSTELLHIDWAKNTEYYSSRVIHNAVKLLQPMYGDMEQNFTFGDEVFSINSLILVLKKLYELQFKKDDCLGEKLEISQITRYGEKALMRALGISSKNVSLLRLLAFDISNLEQKEHLISFKPLIRFGKLYYLVPSHFDQVSIEKCIDKIISTEVKILNSSDGQKGYVFEENIEAFFKELNIEFARVAPDEHKGIPEFDGIFLLDDYIFFYDAKASIKPENLQEAYNNLQSVFYKGYYQLIKRTNVLLDEKKRGLIKAKTKLDIENKKLAPFLLSNHFYFNGYRDLKFTYGDKEKHIPIIDFSTFKKIMLTKKVPIWIYDEKINKYRNVEQSYNSAEELYNYLCNQIDGLMVTDAPFYQLTDDLIAFQIVKPIEISGVLS
ncbi:hypothetical protein HP398_20290 [Brevibacillus sp. HB1.4B]|uniref:hypothetical protein n=1 Tax=Brevibacillus sp. HB1.4B TaxID=2738845 RepID=UPI00156B257B|nr:hypothetical protein [Brevibacillus sp. HB1.4B]NRS18783.1 hypothetical protein [Brevibacillus sp. HB1.4B]